MSNSNVKSKSRKAAVRQTAARKTAGRGKRPAKAPSSGVTLQPTAQAPRTGSKLAKVIELLDRKQGVGVAELTSVTRWLPHTARAALTGLRKRGFKIERFRGEDESSHCRIAVSPGLRQARPDPVATVRRPMRRGERPAADLDASLKRIATMTIDELRRLWRERR